MTTLDAGTETRADGQRWRFLVLGVGLFALAFLVLARLVSVQLFAGDLSASRLDADRKFLPRGVIVDQTGALMAADYFLYQITAAPNALKDDVERIEVAQQLSPMINVPAEQILKTLIEKQNDSWVKLAENVPFEQGEALREFIENIRKDNDQFPLQHVALEATPMRYYPEKRLASHLMGFVNPARDSLYGVENYYDDYLLAQGLGSYTAGIETSLDALPSSIHKFVPSMAHNDLVLTIDRGVQWIIEEELLAGINQYKAQGGTIVVMEPKTGAILGIASWPNFDPNRYGESDTSIFLDPAISQQYEPGSIFKVITMGAALDAKLIKPDTQFYDGEEYVIGQRVIRNSDYLGLGTITAQDALAWSRNVVTAQVAELLETELFYQYVRRFGFGAPTEVDLAGEVSGAVKEPGNELWSKSDLGTNSFGQGIAVTPLQFANAAAAIANGGKLMRPYVVKARVIDGRVFETKPAIIREVLEPESADKLIDMMVHTVLLSNHGARVPGYTVAGKSGTAQIPSPEGYLQDQIITSFIGIAPAYEPKLVILVKLERPDYRYTQWADDNVVPIFAKVTKRLLLHLNIPPEGVR